MFPRRNGLAAWRTYWQKYGDDVTWAQDTVDNNAVKAYRVQASGTTVVIDRAGQIVYRDASPTSYDTLREQSLKALN